VTAVACLEDIYSLFAAYEDGVAGTWNLRQVVPALAEQERLPQGTVIALAHAHGSGITAALVRRDSGAGLDLAVWAADSQKYTAVPYAHTVVAESVYVAVIGDRTVVSFGGEGLLKIWGLRW